MFEGCSNFNQAVTIGENISNCWGMFKDCISLNQTIEIKNINCFCKDLFKNCTSLLPQNVVLYCKRVVQKSLQKKLKEMWGTEKVKEEITIVKVKAVKSIAINKIHYILKGDKIGEINGKEINKLTIQEIHKQLENLYMSGNLVALEIGEKSDNSMRILSIYFDDVKFCIDIVDEWDDTVYYYNSGEGEELELELLQEYYLVALDVFKNISYDNNEDKSELTGWLSFLITESLEDAEKLIGKYPWLEGIYREIASYREKPEETLMTYSQMLKELDRNTMQYIIEEKDKEIEEKDKRIEEKDAEIARLKRLLEEK